MAPTIRFLSDRGIPVMAHIGLMPQQQNLKGYKIAGRAFRLHEISRFVREDGGWYYVDGTFPDAKAG